MDVSSMSSTNKQYLRLVRILFFCIMVLLFLEPSSAISANSSGSKIQTVDGNIFNFNGHGEYTFLKTEDVEIQVRYHIYQESDKKIVTFFEAFSLFATDNHTYEVHLNRTDSLLHVYENGEEICRSDPNISRPKPCTTSKLSTYMVLAGNEVVILGGKLRGLASSINFKTENYMSITLKQIDTTRVNISGLAGQQTNRKYVFGNGTTVNVTESTGHIMNEYGESWALKENTSHFDYSLTGRNFTFYNPKDKKAPKVFLADLLGNLTALFSGFSDENITNFNNTCRDYWDKTSNNDCLLAIAGTGEIESGLDIMKAANHSYYIDRLLHNKPPTFGNMSKTIVANNSQTITIDLNEYAYDSDNDMLTFNVSMDIDEYTLINGVFTWNVSTGLRYSDTRLVFSVQDNFKGRENAEVIIKYCGCDELTQCNFKFDNENSTEHVHKAGCTCPPHFFGLYCEHEEDPCTNFTCFENRCTKHSGDSYPCDPCPKGRHGNIVNSKQMCEDIDECAEGYSGEDRCSQHCNNTDGSFTCSCDRGYDLNINKYSCDDIDECSSKTDNCTGNENCRNTDGAYQCVCKAGYSRDKNNNCNKTTNPAYVGSLTINIDLDQEKAKEANKTINNAANRVKMQKKLEKLFNGTKGLSSVEVFAIIIIQTSTNRAKRETTEGFKLDVQYVVYWVNKTVGHDVIDKALDTKFYENIVKPGANSIDLGIEVKLQGAHIEVKNPNQTGLCSVPSQNVCQESSTRCINTNDLMGVECKCLSGYTEHTSSENFCDDINECDTFTKDRETGKRCVHGNCKNTVGSWSCHCPDGRTVQNVNNASYPVYRCQGNYQYIGKVNFVLTQAKNNEVKAVVIETVKSLLNTTKTIEGLPMREIFLDVEFIKAENRSNGGGVSNVNATYILKIGENLTWASLNKFQSDVFNGTYRYKSNASWEVVTIISSLVLDEKNYNLCNITNKTKCDPTSTTCSVHNGSYACACKTGYSYSDGYKCMDIDECTTKTATCENGTCNNLQGSWECLCNETSKFEKDDDMNIGRCTDINECDNTEMYICNGGNCTDRVGGWNCTCADGYHPQTNLKDKVYTCTDIDECVDGSGSCNGTCRNIPGSWYCECLEGYTNETIENETIICKDINECDNTEMYICNGGNCTDRVGGWNCTCAYGYYPHPNLKDKVYTCTDIDECETGSGSCNGTCRNIPGGWYCECLEGYTNETVGNETVICRDINECNNTDDMYTCKNGTCTNRVGGWNCTCADGYYPYTNLTDKVYTCIEIDECRNNDFVCQGGGKCENTDGNWHCNCSKGYYLTEIIKDKVYTCNDIDECDTSNPSFSGSCSNGGKCKNYQGTWNCSCLGGFELERKNDTFIACKDYDECSDLQHTCTHGGTCINLPGNWTCECPPGYNVKYVNEKQIKCEDIDECKYGSVKCLHGGACVNLQGNWKCECPTGFDTKYVSDTFVDCIDIDECKARTESCINASSCANTLGSWSCECPGDQTVSAYNETSKLCSGGFQYVAKVTFKTYIDINIIRDKNNITNETVMIKIKKELSIQLREMYKKILNDPTIWIEIINVTFSNSSRKRREANQDKNTTGESVSAEYIVHTENNQTTSEFEHITKTIQSASQENNNKPTCNSALVQCQSFQFNTTTIDLCKAKNTLCNASRSTCSSTDGTFTCKCNPGYTKTTGNKCEDPCENSKCHRTSTCSRDINDDGYICGCTAGRIGTYCESVVVEDSKQDTLFIAVGSSLGGLVLMLIGIILAVCRWKSTKLKEAEKMSLKHMDEQSFKHFDSSFLATQYLNGSTADKDSLPGNRYLPRVKTNGQKHKHQNGHVPSVVYSTPKKTPYHRGSLPDLTDGGEMRSYYNGNNRRLSDQQQRPYSFARPDAPARYSGSDRQFGERVSPLADYGRPRSPKPDYHEPKPDYHGPKPDYHRPKNDIQPHSFYPEIRRSRNHDGSRDSGLANGYSSDSNEYVREERGRPGYSRHDNMREELGQLLKKINN